MAGVPPRGDQPAGSLPAVHPPGSSLRAPRSPKRTRHRDPFAFRWTFYSLADGATRRHFDGTRPGPVRADIDGNIRATGGWVGYGYDGIHVFTPEGERMGHIRLPETTSNLVFGGPKRNRLMMPASQSIYAVYVNTRGAHIT